MKSIRVVDSHTGGEPTRIVVEGGPDLGAGPLTDRLERFRRHHDRYRAAVVNEPRGSDVLVGGLLCEPQDPSASAGIIFFNNVGMLGMCGHGTIGLMVTLAYLGRIKPGRHRIETPVGTVTAELHDESRVTVENVPSYRAFANVAVEVPGYGRVVGDVAWGGNWFFLVKSPDRPLSLDNVDELIDFTWQIRLALRAAGITGADGKEIDHVELFTKSSRSDVDSRNFVLCPGRAYDRSPCGTGTSAKLACLFADGVLKPGEVFRQESFIGSVFEGRVDPDPTNSNRVLPKITGSAFVTGEAKLYLDERDPFCWGISRESWAAES